MTNEQVSKLVLGDIVRYHGVDYAVEVVHGDDPTPSVKLVGLPFEVYPRDLEALPTTAGESARSGQHPAGQARPSAEEIETPGA